MKQKFTLLGVLMASTAWAGAAYAADEQEKGGTEIVVTAARHEQNLQKVSAAVSVFDGSALKEAAATNVGQVLADVPSLQATAQPGGFSVDVRGMGGDLPAGSTQSSSAMVFDGVYNINSQGTTVGFFDVARIEVSPGPQSTRYGPNADGGIVSVISNDPKVGKLEGSGALTVGNYGLVRGEAVINVPLGDKLALRVAGAAMGRGSYFTPAQDSQRAQSLRVKLLYKPSEDLSLKLGYQFDHIGGAGSGSNVFPVFTNKVAVYSGDSINNYSNPWAVGVASNPINENHANIDQHTFSGAVSYVVAKKLAVDAQASYIKMAGGETGCIYAPPWSVTAGGPFPICGAKMNEFAPFHQFSSEVRLHNADGPVQWNLGYYHWDYLWAATLENASFFTSPANTTSTNQNAIFGEITYPVTDTLRVIAGLRQSWDHRWFQFANNGALTPAYSIDFSHVDYRAGVEYDVAPRSMLYGTVSTGYRPGGLSTFSAATNSPISFQSEINTAFEIGTKNRFFGNKLQVNADVFYYQLSNYQDLDKYVGFVPTGYTTACTNGDTRLACVTPTFGVQAHTLGFEAQVRLNVTPDDVLRVNGTWLDAKFNKKQGQCATVGLNAAAAKMVCPVGYNSQAPNAADAPAFFDLAGAVQPHSPHFSVNFGYDHTFNLANGATIKVGGSGFYSTGYWVNPVQDIDLYGYQPAYITGGLTGKFTSPSRRYSLSAYVKNINNYAVKQSVLPATALGDPRTFGVTLGAKL
jgi:iron complex outermembrane receptor protein